MANPEFIAQSVPGIGTGGAVGEDLLSYVRRTEGPKVHHALDLVGQPLVQSLQADRAPEALIHAARAVAHRKANGGWNSITETTANVVKVFSRCVKAGYAPSPTVLYNLKRLLRSAKVSANLNAKAAADAEKRRHEGFWNHLRDGAIAVADSPIFKGAIAAATACIPGVGAILAPIAVAVETGVTNMIKDAAEGKPAGQDALNMVSKVASSALSQVPAASPAIGAAIQAGETTAKQVWDTANTAVAYVRAAGQPPALITGLKAAREMVLRAQKGDPAAIVQLRRLVAKAKSGDQGAVHAFALVTSVITQIKHIPPLTKGEMRRLNFRGVHWGVKAMGAASLPLAKLNHLSYNKGEPSDELDDNGEGDDSEEPEEVEATVDESGALKVVPMSKAAAKAVAPPKQQKKKTGPGPAFFHTPLRKFQTEPSKSSKTKIDLTNLNLSPDKAQSVLSQKDSTATAPTSSSQQSTTPTDSPASQMQSTPAASPQGGGGGGGGFDPGGGGLEEEEEEDFDDDDTEEEEEEQSSAGADEVIGAKATRYKFNLKLTPAQVLRFLTAFRIRYHKPLIKRLR